MSQENASDQDLLEKFQIEKIYKIIASYDSWFMNMDSRQTAAYQHHRHALLRDIFTIRGPPYSPFALKLSDTPEAAQKKMQKLQARIEEFQESVRKALV